MEHIFKVACADGMNVTFTKSEATRQPWVAGLHWGDVCWGVSLSLPHEEMRRQMQRMCL
jgi:hypothetical protein